MGESPLPHQSFYHPIYRLPAGHLLIFSKQKVEVKKIDFLTLRTPQKRGRLLDFAEEARRLVDRSIQYQMEGKNRVGVLLSGGVDSSAVLCGLNKLNFEVIAYHWSFAGIHAADESDYANAVSSKHKIMQRNIEVGDMIRTASYFDTDWSFQAPYNHSFYKLFERTKQKCLEDGVKYVANGYLGDVLFGPNQDVTFTSLIRSLPLQEIPKYLKESVGTVWYAKRNETKDGNHPMLQRIPWYQHFLSDEAMNLMKEAHTFIPPAASFEEELTRCSDNETDSVLELGLFNDDVNLMYPLSSRELLEFTLQLPLGYRMIPTGGQWVDKPVLRLAYRDVLPKEIISRNHRQVINAMEEVYVYKNASQVYDLLIHSKLATVGIIDTEKLRRLIHDKSKLTLSASGLICCIMTELWLRQIKNNKGKENHCNVSNEYCFESRVAQIGLMEERL
ncbi:asparagine synthase C-terminal domain-containing protein [Paenibacillus popilliae]|nr:asparagine synthase C-terminal domain-containing protein [Paenibacillus popilliae]